MKLAVVNQASSPPVPKWKLWKRVRASNQIIMEGEGGIL